MRTRTSSSFFIVPAPRISSALTMARSSPTGFAASSAFPTAARFLNSGVFAGLPRGRTGAGRAGCAARAGIGLATMPRARRLPITRTSSAFFSDRGAFMTTPFAL